MHARFALAGALIMLLAWPARAQEEVIVTATRLGSTPGVWKDRVRVIGEDEIESWSGSTLADLLARASVLDVRRRGPAQADLSLRGSGFEQILVLIDGVPVNDPQTGHHNLDLPITIDDIARIEILPGIASSIHGPGAFAGVVNIVTKAGVPQESVFRASAGSFSTHASSVSLAGNNLKLNRTLSYSGRASASLESTTGHRKGTEATSLVLSHGATIFHPGGITRFRLGYQDRRFGAEDFYGPWPAKESTGTLLMFFSSLLGSPDHLEVLPRLSFRRHTDDFLLDRNNPSGYRSDHETIVVGAELAFRLNQTAIGSLVLGLEHNEQEVESSTLGDRDRRRFGVFFEHGFHLSRYFHLNWAVRADWGVNAENRTFAFVSPSLSLRADPAENWKVLLSAARGFRMPSFTELYYSSPANQGEPALSPEKSSAADLTVVFAAAKGITLTASGFVRSDTNLVDWIKLTETAPWKATNVGSITSGGAEIRIQIRPSYDTRLELGYTRLELSKNKPAPFSKYVFRQAIDDVLLRATGQLLLGIKGTLSARFRRRPETDGSILIDARLHRPFGPVEVYLEASNILDAYEEEIPGAPLPGFSLVLGMAFRSKENKPPAARTALVQTELPALKLAFIIDKDFDKSRIVGMFQRQDPAGLESRARSMGISPKFARVVHRAKDISEIEGELNSLVETRFQKHRPRIDSALEEYRWTWRGMREKFSRVVTEVTDHAWFHNEYICVVSAFHPGLSDWYGNKIAAGYNLTPVLKKRIVAHELLLSHLFHIMRKYHPKEEIDDWRVWAFSEITAVFILDDSRLKSFWPNTPAAGNYFAKSNYPQLASLEKKLKKLFDERKSFKEYMDESLIILKEFSNKS